MFWSMFQLININELDQLIIEFLNKMFLSNSPRFKSQQLPRASFPKYPTINCAFHQSQSICYFCNFKQCLLPLCKQCVPIHRKQHTKIPQPIHLIHVEQALSELQSCINNQAQRTEQFMNQVHLQYQMSNNLHGNLKRNMAQERDKIVQMVFQSYEPYLKELDSNFQRRQKWFIQIQNTFKAMKQEFESLKRTLNGQKYLRTLIMWHRIQPGESINDMMNKITRQWQTPDYTPYDPEDFIKALSKSKNVKTLEVDGDFGLSKLIKTLRTVKLGEQKSKQHKNIGISITEDKKIKDKSKQGKMISSSARETTKSDQNTL